MASGEKKRRGLWILGSCSGTAGGLAKAVCLLQCLALGGAFDVPDGLGLLLNGVSLGLRVLMILGLNFYCGGFLFLGSC